MKTSWNSAEDYALQSIPVRAQIIYLRGIRRYMDYKTGISGGVKRRISLTMLAEISEETINRQLIKPTKNMIRESIKQLKKIGLIERIPDKDYLIFFLPLADTNESVSNNYNTTTTQLQHTISNIQNSANNIENTNSYDENKNNRNTTTTHPVPDNCNTHQESGIQDSYLYIEKIEKEKPKSKPTTVFKPPTEDEVNDYAKERGLNIPGFFHHYKTVGWVVGKYKTPMKSWKSAASGWSSRQYKHNNNQRGGNNAGISNEEWKSTDF